MFANSSHGSRPILRCALYVLFVVTLPILYASGSSGNLEEPVRILALDELRATHGDACDNNCVNEFSCKTQFLVGEKCFYCNDVGRLKKCCAVGQDGQTCNSEVGEQCGGADAGMFVAASHNTTNQSCDGCAGVNFTQDGNCNETWPNTATGDDCNCESSQAQ